MKKRAAKKEIERRLVGIDIREGAGNLRYAAVANGLYEVGYEIRMDGEPIRYVREIERGASVWNFSDGTVDPAYRSDLGPVMAAAFPLVQAIKSACLKADQAQDKKLKRKRNYR